ncbi:MAG: hypothetical protein GWN80_05515, partial [Gammaproteobacteria bacterium]|nr:hypothetical protein [Gammaproteobacteria bacterium]NIW96116.1 hypothetical protein [Phycisphaerae bacterium]
MNEQIVELLEQYVKQEMQTLPDDFAALERVSWQTILSFGAALLQRLADKQPHGYQGSSITCACGGSMRFVQHRSRDIHTVLGWIKLKRAYYHCADCGTGLAPYDQASGLGSQQVSSALAKACCTLAVDDSFQQVSEKLQQLFGQRVSDDTIQQIVHQVGNVIVQQQDQQLDRFFDDRHIPPAQVTPARLCVAVDGTSVQENDGCHEAKTGCIYWPDEQFEQGKRYLSRLETSENFG